MSKTTGDAILEVWEDLKNFMGWFLFFAFMFLMAWGAIL